MAIDRAFFRAQLVAKLGPALVDRVASAGGWVDGSRGDLRKAFERAMRKFEPAAGRLAKLGWVIPMSMNPTEIYDILDQHAHTEGAIDAFFIDLFEADKRRHFNRTIREILARRECHSWRPLIRQAASAYRRGHYALTVPALFVVIEGVVMQGRGDGLLTFTKNRVKRMEAETPDLFTLVLWRIVHRFLVQLFGGATFDGPEPPHLNRNWILHGRTPANWTQADSLRLFQAVDTVSSVVEKRRHLR